MTQGVPVQLGKECQYGKKLTFEECIVGLAVRAEANLISSEKDDEPICAGRRSTITEIELNNEGKMHVFTEWGMEKIRWEHDHLRDIVFNEH
jgi:hypothetical protein